MAFLILVGGLVLVVAAIRDTHASLFSALGQDVPAFAVWGAAIIALAAIGFVPGLKPISRGLLALVITVLILTNYKAILDGFQAAWTGAEHQAGGVAAGSAQGGSGGLDFNMVAKEAADLFGSPQGANG